MPSVIRAEQSALPVAAIVMTKNEERAITTCLQALTEFDQVYVVDSGSTDSTVELATQLGALVVNFDWNGRYPKKKQWCLENLPFQTEWVLFVDADEYPSCQLLAELRELFSKGLDHSAFDVILDYVFLGRQLRHGHRITKRVLLRLGSCNFPEVDDLGASNMWEVEGHYQPLVTGSIGSLSGRMIHHDRESLFHYFERHNRYSDWEAYLRRRPRSRGVVGQARSSQGQLFDRVPGKPLTFFVYSYVLRRGYRDGAAGLHYALSLAFYHWMSYVKTKDANAEWPSNPTDQP